MQTTEEEERFRKIRQLSQFLRRGAKIQVQSFQSKALVFSIVPCFLGHKRFLDIGASGCKVTSLVSCIPVACRLVMMGPYP